MLMHTEAPSHLRFGKVISNIFTTAASPEKVRQLADFAIRHYWSHLEDDRGQLPSLV